jgi:flagellin
MAITINTNISSMIVQQNLAKSTTSLNQAIERMTTGYKINHAADNAAGYSIARNWEAQISSLDIAADNAATGADMLSTLEDNYALISSHVQRVRDLTEQAANGTYGSQSKKAIESEITARLEEINRIALNCEFNGIKMMDGTDATAKSIQVGIDGSAAKSQISLAADLFASGKIDALFNINETSDTSANYGPSTAKNEGEEDVANTDAAKDCAGTSDYSGHKTSTYMLGTLDKVIARISDRITTLGAAQNRIESAIESIGVQSENITSSLSTLRDADVATESSNYIKAQILQQASATLLATANQSPSIALNLL